MRRLSLRSSWPWFNLSQASDKNRGNGERFSFIRIHRLSGEQTVGTVVLFYSLSLLCDSEREARDVNVGVLCVSSCILQTSGSNLTNRSFVVGSRHETSNSESYY